jgi:hypothetical protein
LFVDFSVDFEVEDDDLVVVVVDPFVSVFVKIGIVDVLLVVVEVELVLLDSVELELESVLIKLNVLSSSDAVCDSFESSDIFKFIC